MVTLPSDTCIVISKNIQVGTIIKLILAIKNYLDDVLPKVPNSTLKGN